MKRLAIICDIDGTLALRGERGPHDHDRSMEDAVNWPLVDILHLFHDKALLLVSGREAKYRAMTEYWLQTHHLHLPWQELFMRVTDDTRPDNEVKREMYQTHIEPRYTVLCVFDDRNRVVQMWRELGLLCFQVAEGDF